MTEELTINAQMGPLYEVVVNHQDISVSDDFKLEIVQESFALEAGVGDGGAVTLSPTVDVEVTAAIILNANRAVTYDGYFCDETNLDKYAGITKVSVGATEATRVAREGVLEVPGWSWSPDQPIFIGTQGVLTQSAPTGVPLRRIGWAITPTKINLDPYPIIGV